MKRLVVLWPAALLSFAVAARASDDGVARFAMVVGVNRSVDRDVAELRFADDDAARYFDLFDALGIDTVLLTRMDENTRRLHPNAGQKAAEPVLHGVDARASELALRVASAKEKGRKTALYFVYAGHGNAENGEGYVSLEDARLTGRDLEKRVLDRVGPDEAHFIVDACQSYFLAYSRGPGGKRVSARGFASLGALGRRRNVGVLLSTSSARESHEWERVQAGVFSHEVRSGLYGAADADGDGSVTYREIAAFVQRANAAIPNERFRPEVYAHPPERSETLLDLRSGLSRRIEVDGRQAAHYLVEDQNGVYLAQFHNAPGERVTLVRPRGSGRMYLERVADGKEYVIEPGPEVVATAGLSLVAPRAQARGAAHEAFSRMFELSFGRTDVARFGFGSFAPHDALAGPESRAPTWRTYTGFGLLGLAGAGAILGGYGIYSAEHERNGVDARSSMRDVATRNDAIDTANTLTAVGFSVFGVAALSGAALLIWPDAPVRLDASASERGVGARLHGSF